MRNGQLGIENTENIGDESNEMGDFLINTNLGSGRGVLQSQGGNLHSCAILDDFSLKCWGRNHIGQLGYEDTNQRGHQAFQMGDYLEKVDVGDYLIPYSVHLGDYHTCVSFSDGVSLKCFGQNGEGQLGQGHTSNIGDGFNEMGEQLPTIQLGAGNEIELCFDYSPTFSPTIYVPSSCSSRFSFGYDVGVLTSSQNVKCWGHNARGQLGYGNVEHLGDEPNELGDYFPFLNLDGDSVISFHSGSEHNCAHFSDLSIKCWGYNIYGQLGYGDIEDRGDESGEMGEYLPQLNTGSDFLISSTSLGRHHSLVVSGQGNLKCWGFNTYGQLGYGDTNDRGDAANEMGSYLPFISLGAGRKVEQGFGGGYHSCVLLDNSRLKCFGENGSGELGQGNITNLGDDPNEMSDYLPYIPFPFGVQIEKVGIGWFHNGIISQEGDLFLWGWNINGQLGLGHSNDIGDNENEMGEYLQLTDLGSGRTSLEFSGGERHSVTFCYQISLFNIFFWF